MRSLDLSGAAEEITFAMTKVTTKVTTTSRSAVTNLMRNLTTTQSMSTTQMTHTDADAHSFCCPVSRVFCAKVRLIKERALLPTRVTVGYTLVYTALLRISATACAWVTNGGPAR